MADKTRSRSFIFSHKCTAENFEEEVLEEIALVAVK